MKKRIAVITPFLDKRHGTERYVAEQVERLSPFYEFHIYSTRVEDIAGAQKYSRKKVKKKENQTDNSHEMKSTNMRSFVAWHKIPSIPGPYLLKYLWWFIANHIWRLFDYIIRGLKYDIKYSPGVNCLDAEIIVVFHVFAEFYKCVKEGMRLSKNPLRSWLFLIHRYFYYQIIIGLERIVYRRPKVILGAISDKVSELLVRYYGRSAYIIYPGADFIALQEGTRLSCYKKARESLNILNSEFVLLLIGNDWYEKGLPCLLLAMNLLKDLPLRLLIRGQDDRTLYEKMIKQLELSNKISFIEPIADIFKLYAASDLYVSPSLYDSFAIPPAEAMVCGLPVIVSSRAGISEIITDGIDGFILKDPMDVDELAKKIRLLYENPDLRNRLAEKAVKTARKYTWEQSAKKMKEIFDIVLHEKESKIATSSCK